MPGGSEPTPRTPRQQNRAWGLVLEQLRTRPASTAQFQSAERKERPNKGVLAQPSQLRGLSSPAAQHHFVARGKFKSETRTWF